jgi:light-regulated signal transduction histidine kinase (bacteriophytochrome)
MVEDSPDDAELVEIELIKGGFAPDITRVEDAPSMAAQLARDGWDVVLSDYHLPRFGAEGALETLKASGRDLPFLIMSGMVKPEEAVKLMKRGAHDFLDKASLARLAPAIEREIKDAAERRQRQQADRELRQAVESLTKANTELERFAYVASHDLQEPLRTLTSFTQLLERRWTGQMDPEAQEYMAFIVAAARRMHDLINDLLTYSRVSSGDDFNFEDIDLNSVCRQALDNLKSSIETSGATVRVSELPHIHGDEVQMMQLFQNLIGNAVKFRRPGVKPDISVLAEKTAEGWTITVADNGIGIEKSDQDIFEIFRRLHNHRDYPGTGVGLAICKCIVERHQGRIWVESTPGQGSTFHFTVPAEAVAA